MSTSTHVLGRTTRRLGAAAALALTAGLALAGPAAAHAEVEADRAQALAENVVLGFVSEAESDSAGFTEMRVVLPRGIAPGDVTLVEAPEGWKFTATGDGYTVGGPKLPVGTDAEYKIKVRQLPDAKEVAFKTVETYSDGEISRWIELPGDGGSEQPAPLLELKPAAPGATPVAPSPTASRTASSAVPSVTASTPATAPSDTATATTTAEKAEDEDGGGSTGLVVGAVLAALALAGGAWWLVRRRGAASGS
ncbi:DUF1775 domain-containing protein [Streptomyces sp. NPDC093094]|uniref:DUF1775 domain-containing protein n=1 Tax=Streptomyces sp. NPDC093094 TaxID=3366026 RepID=UPI0037FA97D4